MPKLIYTTHSREHFKSLRQRMEMMVAELKTIEEDMEANDIKELEASGYHMLKKAFGSIYSYTAGVRQSILDHLDSNGEFDNLTRKEAPPGNNRTRTVRKVTVSKKKKKN